MRAALRTFVIGAIVVQVGALGPLSSAAHASAAPAVGAPPAPGPQAGRRFDTPPPQTRTRPLPSPPPPAPALPDPADFAARRLYRSIGRNEPRRRGCLGRPSLSLRRRAHALHPLTEEAPHAARPKAPSEVRPDGAEGGAKASGTADSPRTG